MKRFLNLLGLVSALSIIATSCEKAPFLTLSTPKTINFSDLGGSQSITFTANRDWSVSSSDAWCKVSPSYGSKADGNITVTLTCEPNTTYDLRSATLTVKVEELSEIITVTQDTNLGLLVSPTSYDLTNAAQSIEVEVRANVKYAVEIDAACKDWITQTGTKALSKEKITFAIAANESYDNREGKIVFRQLDGNLSETLIVRQSQTDAILTNTSEYFLSNEAQSINVEVNANVTYDVSTEEEWIHLVETKALSTSNIALNIDANNTYYSRKGQIELIGKDGTVQETIIINQKQTDALFITGKEKVFNVSSRGGDITLNVFHNVDYEVESLSIPDWVSITTTNVDDYNAEISLRISQNTQYVGREASLAIKGGQLSDTVAIFQNQVNSLNVDLSEIKTDWQEKEITVVIKRNVDYSLVFPEWLKEISTQSEISGDFVVDTIVFRIIENLGSERDGIITLEWLNEDVENNTTIQVYQSGIVVTVSEPGTLLNIIGSERVPKISSITIDGYLNGTDVLVIRRMTSLVKLDLENAHIRTGGKPYYVVDNYESYSTKDDIITSYMFGFTDNPVFDELILPKSITRIEERAFWMSPITKISDIPGTVQIEREAFYYSAVQSLTLGEGITSIEPMTFSMSGLRSITLPNSIVTIDNGAFRYARSLMEVNIPNAIEKIGNEAFCQCPLSASSITIPASVKELGYGIYRSCSNIKEIHIKALPSTLTTIWGAIADTKTVTLFIPKGTYDEYYLTPLGAFETIIEE